MVGCHRGLMGCVIVVALASCGGGPQASLDGAPPDARVTVDAAIDAPGCVPSNGGVETCDDLDNDCDGTADEDFDKCASIANCGACGAACVLDHASPACAHTGTEACTLATTSCEIAACDCAGANDCWWDADGEASDGCEYRCDLSNGGVEVCDGVDNDCDGKIDNLDDLSGDVRIGLACEGGADGVCGDAAHAGLTACAYGQVRCEGGNVIRPYQLAETCNGVDDDCDGAVDDLPVDVGQACGDSAVAPCHFGTTTCTGGTLSCTGAHDQSAEICDGVDNDCDGTIDGPTAPVPAGCTCTGGGVTCPPGTGAETCNGVDDDGNGVIDDNLTDAPSPAQRGCWEQAGNCCSFHGAFWCPPPGATCTDTGSLTSPCNAGHLVCGGAAGWRCVGDEPPTFPDGCDGIDNNCDGQIDNGFISGTGVVCGPDGAGDCQTGLTNCVSGRLACAGEVLPQAEVCGGGDEDCDGVIDDCAPEGAACVVPYDVSAYPGDRGSAPCRPGLTIYDPTLPGVVCSPTSGVAPLPEICDGVDNDCDGVVDEVGTAPDGVGAVCP